MIKDKYEPPDPLKETLPQGLDERPGIGDGRYRDDRAGGRRLICVFTVSGG
jgi:hypothetical protein